MIENERDRKTVCIENIHHSSTRGESHFLSILDPNQDNYLKF